MTLNLVNNKVKKNFSLSLVKKIINKARAEVEEEMEKEKE